MPAIKPVSDLRNYNEVLADVHSGSPVFLTRNGRGCYAILDMQDYDHAMAELRLLRKLEEGRESGNEDGWDSSDEVRRYFEAKAADDE